MCDGESFFSLRIRVAKNRYSVSQGWYVVKYIKSLKSTLKIILPHHRRRKKGY